MKSRSEYLEQASKYDVLAAEAAKERRKTEYQKLAEIYRYLAEEALRLERKGSSAA